MKPTFNMPHKTARFAFAALAFAAATVLLLLGLTQGHAQAPEPLSSAPLPVKQRAQALGSPALAPALQAPSATVAASPAKMILGPDPLTKEDTNAVMTWIAAKMAVEKLPYCYRQSYGRGAGETLSKNCSGDLDKDGLLCYPKCKSGYDGKGPVCWGSCPAGFKDIGAFCQKPKEYGRGAGYPWKGGDKPFSLDGARKRCGHDHPEGCEKDGEIIYPKCKSGFHKVGCCICSPDCPSGWSDSGTGCTKPSYGRGAGEPLACKPGLERDGLLCYPSCKAGFHGVGPVCWQNCPTQAPKECGAGCSKTTADCATNTTDMVVTPVMCVASLATFGEASSATSGARAAEEASEAAAKAAKLRKLYKSAEEGVKVATDLATVGQSTADEVLLFSDL